MRKIYEFSDLKKLSKIDRIDYLLQKKYIEGKFDYEPSMFPTILWFLQGLIVLILLWISAFGIESLKRLHFLFVAAPWILRFFIFILLIELAVMFVVSIEKKKMLKKLDEEKFK